MLSHTELALIICCLSPSASSPVILLTIENEISHHSKHLRLGMISPNKTACS